MSLYEIKPIKVGNVVYPQNKTPIFSIDLVSRDEIVFFDSESYPELMVSRELYEKISKESFTGFSFPDHVKEFSIQHDINHPNKKLPDWIRMMPYRNEQQNVLDMYLTNDNKIFVNSQFKKFLQENARVKRCTFEKITVENEVKKNELEQNQPIFKQEKEKPLIGILAVFIVVAIIGYIVFN